MDYLLVIKNIFNLIRSEYRASQMNSVKSKIKAGINSYTERNRNSFSFHFYVVMI